jgi:DNA-binding phage protein
MRDRPHDEAMAELYRDDPAFAVDYLNYLLEEGDEGDFWVPLQQLSKAYGVVVQREGISAAQLYDALLETNSPELSDLLVALRKIAAGSVRQPLSAL